MWRCDEPAHQELQDAVARICVRFDDDYWLRKDTEKAFPHEFHRAVADAGGIVIAMPP